MSGTRPTWVSRLLGLPGSTSFDRFDTLVAGAGGYAEAVSALPDERLRAAVHELPLFQGAALNRAAAPQFLAVLREAAKRATGVTAVDEQLQACCALLSGYAVEMDTGEGKTLAGALAAAGYALSSRRVHVLSVNDYLAERDAEWMRPLFVLLGITVGWIGQHTTHRDRRRAYENQVVYAPASEVGFDVLRDRFAVEDAHAVTPVFDVAIIDEADAVMIDEATIPLVLAGSADQESEDFAEATVLVESLEEVRDFRVDSDRATASLTDAGLDRVEAALGGVNLYDGMNTGMLTRINLALHARALVQRDVDYLVTENGLKLVNASRGRVAHLQRWPDGLHAALEAKERLPITPPGMVLDTITIQDLLLSYRTLAGMSGTITAVADDLLEFYKLSSGRVERHRPNIRTDAPDRVLLTSDEKLNSVVDEIRARHAMGQPVLVGTQTVAESESLADLLHIAGIQATVLNAKNDAEEAAIIARAGEFGAVTISTQMSGRGTDIRLGGIDGQDRDRVVASGGLAVIATGRYVSRRLDAQLRGRSGRQGDPGTSITIVALDDELVQSNATPHVLATLARAGASMSQQRRREIVNEAQRIAEGIRLDRHRSTWAYNRAITAQRRTVLEHRDSVRRSDQAIRMLANEHAEQLSAHAETFGGATTDLVRGLTLHYLDEHWSQHLALLQEIRDGIHLRTLAGQNPADEFHRIALREFQGFFEHVYRDVWEFIVQLDPSDRTHDLSELGLRRPSATWTYMVTDDPLGGQGDRLARELGKRWRTWVLRTR